jgi:hypothetical protein
MPVMGQNLSTDDLIRELEAGGILEDRPAGPPVKTGAAPPRPKKSAAVTAPAGRTSGLVFFIVAAVLVAVVGALPFGSLALYPFSLLVTLIHESSHALAGVVSGGSVRDLRLNSDLSGVTDIRGGAMALIAPAGYLGATLAGVALLLTPLRYARQALAVLAAIPLAALVFFHPASLFTAVWCVIFAAALGLAAWKLRPRMAAFLQIFLGVAAGLNAFRDLITLIFISGTSSHIHTDADNMSRALFLPPLFWAYLWAVLSVALLLMACIALFRRDFPSLRSSS